MFTKPMIIAEIGNNHEGSFDIAKKLIIEASKAGVDAVKFQTFEPELFQNSLDKKRFNKLKKFKLSKEHFIKLSHIARKKKLKFISTPLDLKSAYFLRDKVDFIKIASGDNQYYELIDHVLKFNKKTIFSTGLLDQNNLKTFINLIKKKSKKFNNIYFLHCISCYPAKIQNVNLERINFIRKLSVKNVGYSDHTIGLSAALASVFYNVKVIEKHFTLDNNFSNFRDHKLSLNPKDMSKLVLIINDLAKLKMNYNPKISFEERKNINLMRRSYYAKKEIKKGRLFTNETVKCVRPKVKNGFYLNSQIIGKTAKKNIKPNFPITKKDIAF